MRTPTSALTPKGKSKKGKKGAGKAKAKAKGKAKAKSGFEGTSGSISNMFCSLVPRPRRPTPTSRMRTRFDIPWHASESTYLLVTSLTLQALAAASTRIRAAAGFGKLDLSHLPDPESFRTCMCEV